MVMGKKNEEFDSSDWLKDLPLRSANESFQPEQLVSCPQCARKNPPTRLKCLYCAADLPVTEFSEDKQLSRKLETWEKGFNLILLPDEKKPEPENVREIAKILRLETENLEKILVAGKPLPLACAESENEAEILASNLRKKGFETKIISDEKLAVEKFSHRLRGLEFGENQIVLRLFNSNENVEIEREDLCLIVTGSLSERRIESTQKHQRKKENKILDTAEISSDQILIDLYGKPDVGYRIESNGFDFSCLVSDKQLLVAQNIKKLVEKIRAFAPEAKFDSDYNRLRAELGSVWEVEEKRDSKGFVRKGFGILNVESVVTIDNLKQFTRYSRMLKNLL